MLAAAAEAGVLVGCAPDTFLGPGVETVRTAIESGAIGTPAVAHVRLLAGPPEDWHPSPAFLYAELSGPLLDLGTYGVSTAVQLLGPVSRVTALASRPRDEGVIAGGPLAGTRFPIIEPTRVTSVLEHPGGVLTTLTTTFDADGAARHGIELHGSGGTLLGGDLNGFDGPVILRRRGEPDELLELLPGAARQRPRARAAGSLPRGPRRHAAARERRAGAARARGPVGRARRGRERPAVTVG